MNWIKPQCQGLPGSTRPEAISEELVKAKIVRESGSDITCGLEWITALRALQIRKLVDHGSLQLSLFDEQDLAEVTDPNFPGEQRPSTNI
jgi:hypothetical protein